MPSQDIQGRISSVQNIHKITRAMEMVAAARLRKAEERIEVFRKYADGIRRMTSRAVSAAGRLPDLPLLQEHESVDVVAIYLVSSDRGLAGPFTSQLMRAATRRERELRRDGHDLAWYVSGKKGVSSLSFRGYDLQGAYTGFTDRPAYANARDIAQDLIAAYVDAKVDRVEMIYNAYGGPMEQKVTREILLPITEAEFVGGGEDSDGEGEQGGGEESVDQSRSEWIYEPDPDGILRRLAPDYVEVSIYRALLESSASEHGARMTAMQSAAKNAEEMIDDLQMEANRQRQAEITQQLMEIVAGAEALS